MSIYNFIWHQYKTVLNQTETHYTYFKRLMNNLLLYYSYTVLIVSFIGGDITIHGIFG